VHRHGQLRVLLRQLHVPHRVLEWAVLELLLGLGLGLELLLTGRDAGGSGATHNGTICGGEGRHARVGAL